MSTPINSTAIQNTFFQNAALAQSLVANPFSGEAPDMESYRGQKQAAKKSQENLNVLNLIANLKGEAASQQAILQSQFNAANSLSPRRTAYRSGIGLNEQEKLYEQQFAQSAMMGDEVGMLTAHLQKQRVEQAIKDRTRKLLAFIQSGGSDVNALL